MSNTHRLHTEQWCVRSGFGPSHFLHLLTLLLLPEADDPIFEVEFEPVKVLVSEPEGRFHPQYSGHKGDFGSCVDHRISFSVDIGLWGDFCSALGEGYPGGTFDA